MTQISILLAEQHAAELRKQAATSKRMARAAKPGLLARLSERWERYSLDERNPDLGSPDLQRRLHRTGY